MMQQWRKLLTYHCDISLQRKEIFFGCR